MDGKRLKSSCGTCWAPGSGGCTGPTASPAAPSWRAQAQRAEAAQDGGERGRREGGEAHPVFGRCCMNPDKFRNTNAYVDPAKFERAVGKSSVTNFELQINDSEGFLAFVETLKTDRSKACMSVPTQVGARTLQLSKLMMEKAYYLHMRRLFPKMRLLFTDTDSVMVQIFELGPPWPRRT